MPWCVIGLASEEISLRHRWADPMQVLWTTSLNWVDEGLVVARRSVKNEVAQPFNGYRILVDPGHGGRDDGAVYSGVHEKALTLRLSEMIRSEVERAAKFGRIPIQVKLTRSADIAIPLKERVQMANDWKADLFMSVHANSSPSAKAKGFEVYFLSSYSSDEDTHHVVQKENSEKETNENNSDVQSILADVQTQQHIKESSYFAEDIHRAVSLKVRTNQRGVRQGPFTVLSGTQMPAVLVEVGYLTNDEDRTDLQRFSYLKRIASAISSGIIEYVLKVRKIS